MEQSTIRYPNHVPGIVASFASLAQLVPYVMKVINITVLRGGLDTVLENFIHAIRGLSIATDCANIKIEKAHGNTSWIVPRRVDQTLAELVVAVAMGSFQKDFFFRNLILFTIFLKILLCER